MEIFTHKKEPGTFRGTLRGTSTKVRELWAISVWAAAGHSALFISMRDQLLIKRVNEEVLVSLRIDTEDNLWWTD